MPGSPALRACAAGPQGARRGEGPGAAAGAAGRTGCWAPWRAGEGGWAGTRLGPTPRPRRRWQGRGRVPRGGSGLGFRPLGVERARGPRRGRVQSTVRPRLPAANHGPARPPPPYRVLCSFSPWWPSAPSVPCGPAPGLRLCDFWPARTRLCVRACVQGPPLPVPGHIGPLRQGQACPWPCTLMCPQLAQGPQEGLAKAPEKLLREDEL